MNWWWAFWIGLVLASPKLLDWGITLTSWALANFPSTSRPPTVIAQATPDENKPLDLSPYRTGHMHILGGSGAGKTQLIQNLILEDLNKDEAPAIVVIDSQRDMIRTISRLKCFDAGEEHGGRLRIIDPRDHPAMNIFAVNRSRFGSYDDATREQITAGIIETFDYLFSGIVGADLTARQGVLFRYLTRLMLSMPETMGRTATMMDMLLFVEDPARYREAADKLPQMARTFFERAFYGRAVSGDYKKTCEQIAYRLHAILENPTMERLFTAHENKVDLFQELNAGSVILVDTAKDYLKGASPAFGRIFIAMLLQAIHERAALRRRRPAYLYIDEAHEYFDQNIDSLLTQARKYNVGCSFAHQYRSQCTDQLWSSMMANTTIKFASGVSAQDARALAPELRCKPEQILMQPKLTFACFVRGLTPEALKMEVIPGLMEGQLMMDDDDYAYIRKSNRKRVASSISPRHAAISAQSATDPSQPAPY